MNEVIEKNAVASNCRTQIKPKNFHLTDIIPFQLSLSEN